MILLSLEQYAVEFQQWDSQEELDDFLESHQERIVLGESSEYPNRFYSIRVYTSYATHVSSEKENEEIWVVGIISNQNSSTPSVLSLPERNELLIGFNDEVVNVSLVNKNNPYRISLGGLPFNAFFYVSSMETILIFYELGVIAIKPDGHEIWQYSNDIVTKSIVDGELLSLEFLDSMPVTINIKDGKLVNR